MEIDHAKQAVRERIWNALDTARAVHNDTAHGRIPNFRGSDAAADELAALAAWRDARVVKSVPDKAQLPVRARALSEGKMVYMAVPRLADPKPFYLLDPDQLTAPPAEAAAPRAASALAPKVAVEELQHVNLVVLGSVAVNHAGVRIGKGAGYSDLEFAFLTEAGLIGPDTVVVTTVHELQVLDEDLPATEHDVSVDLVITPSGVITCTAPHRPAGLVWEHLSAEKIAAIPALAARAPTAGR
ncbi:5-formyltetrahydrofolate cyclo-ligase [Streptomyces sp. NBRC 110611]|uniref:5-formyltetrahydrofolate cyclo-ligase n=1 Tax=Streptomyces sp. NBRC 110611 TaxID=1621259 RepID=UPI000832B291|nr:5-formyltetrahydrofolate cyclo-ligase [Streptomyces sp. NBRC 110611]